MSDFYLRGARLGILATACAMLAACGSFDGLTGRFAGSLTLWHKQPRFDTNLTQENQNA